MKLNIFKAFLLVTAFEVLSAGSACAAADSPAEISWTFLIFGVLGGLALFLYGMEKMSAGMRKSAGM